jgi:hypothetical protein
MFIENNSLFEMLFECINEYSVRIFGAMLLCVVRQIVPDVSEGHSAVILKR